MAFVPLSAIVIAAVLYAFGVVKARQRQERWPLRYSLSFYLLGLGSYAVIELGFLGTMSSELRWAFVARIALLIFVVPLCIASGKPLELLHRSLGPEGRSRLERIRGSKPVRIIGNAMFATLFVAALLSLFLTRISGVLRVNSLAESGLDVAIPVIGLLLILPMTGMALVASTAFLAIEFLLTFAELLVDAVPGIALRLNGHVLDGVQGIQSALPWWPSALRDQQLAGDAMWFIAEFADLPILVLLLVRWVRSDKRDSRSVDEISDEEYDRLTQAHLRGDLTTSMVHQRPETN